MARLAKEHQGVQMSEAASGADSGCGGVSLPHDSQLEPRAVTWAKEIIEEGHGPPLSVSAEDVLVLAQKVKNAERENERLRGALGEIADGRRMLEAQIIARQALRQENRESASEEPSDDVQTSPQAFGPGWYVGDASDEGGP